MRPDQAYQVVKDDSFRSFGMIQDEYKKLIRRGHVNKTRAEELWRQGNFTGAIESLVGRR